MRVPAWLAASSVLIVGMGCDKAPTPAVPSTGCEGAFDVYEPNLRILSEGGDIELVLNATHEPDVGENDWILSLSSGGNAVESALVVVEPWMPAHGHGISPPTYVGVMGEQPGEYVIPTFDLIMPGVWEFKISIGEDAVEDTAVFTFCAEG